MTDSRAQELDSADPLSAHRSLFVDDGDVKAYLDGNSLGRPLKACAAALRVRHECLGRAPHPGLGRAVVRPPAQDRRWDR